MQIAGVDFAAFGDDANPREFSFGGAVEDENVARAFESCFTRAGSEIFSVLVVFKVAGAAIAVAVRIAVAAAADCFFAVDGGNGVTEPFGRRGRFGPAVEFGGEIAGKRACCDFCVFERRNAFRLPRVLRGLRMAEFGAERDESGFAAGVAGKEEEESGCNHGEGEKLAGQIVLHFHDVSPLRENYFSRISMR